MTNDKVTPPFTLITSPLIIFFSRGRRKNIVTSSQTLINTHLFRHYIVTNSSLLTLYRHFFNDFADLKC